MTTTVRLSQTAPWATTQEINLNSRLRNTYRDRFAYVAGRRFKLSAEYLYSPWWIEEVDHDGEPLWNEEDGFKFGRWAFRLSEAREIIALEVRD
jgi:hypothetical protein